MTQSNTENQFSPLTEREKWLRIDILADDLIIVELKAQERSHPVWQAQLLSYLKLTEKRLGYILNFQTPLMKDGIKRMIL